MMVIWEAKVPSKGYSVLSFEEKKRLLQGQYLLETPNFVQSVA